MRFFILFFYSLSAFSICSSNLELPLTDFINEMSPIIDKPWAAATDEQVSNYKCQKVALTNKEMEEYLEKSGTLSQSLNLLINKEETLTKPAIKTDLSLYQAQDCEDEICKAKKIFGKTQGIELLYMIEKYGLNASHLVYEDTKPWTSEMLKPYLEGLVAVPEFMLPIKKNQQFTKSSTESNDIADASITFYGGIDDFSQKRVTYTTFHEIAHYVAGSLHVEHDEKWMVASGWEEDLSRRTVDFSTHAMNFTPLTVEPPTTGSLSLGLSSQRLGSSLLSLASSRTPSSITTSLVSTDFELSTEAVEESFNKTKRLLLDMKNDDSESFISGYAKTNPLEDIAESITAYRFNPKKLKELSPKRYEYLKNKVFMGIEYLSDSQCDDAASKRQQFVDVIKVE